jgi:hypothetical protein
MRRNNRPSAARSAKQQTESGRNRRRYADTWPRPVLPPYNYSYEPSAEQLDLFTGGACADDIASQEGDG